MSIKPAAAQIHHSDSGVQYLAMNFTQRLAEANLVPSVGSVGDSYDNALAEIISGLYKTEVIWRQRSWPTALAVGMATLKWVDWFNNHRLFGPIGHIPPAELKPKRLRNTRDASRWQSEISLQPKTVTSP